MNSSAYGYLLIASLCGGGLGVLVMWTRQRAEKSEMDAGWRRMATCALGTVATAVSLWGFARSIGALSPSYAVAVMMLMTGWTATLHAAGIPLAPRSLLRVSVREASILRQRWTGVPLFGLLLNKTPLRHLGGKVYLREAGRDLRVVLRAAGDDVIVHMGAVLVCVPWLIYWALGGHWLLISCGLLIHLPLNLYPVLHLRQVMWRIERHLERRAAG